MIHTMVFWDRLRLRRMIGPRRGQISIHIGGGPGTGPPRWEILITGHNGRLESLLVDHATGRTAGARFRARRKTLKAWIPKRAIARSSYAWHVDTGYSGRTRGPAALAAICGQFRKPVNPRRPRALTVLEGREAPVSEQGIRTVEWGDIHVVVLRGDVDVDVSARLSRTLAKLQRECTVFVDAWDVTAIDAVALGALSSAKLRADATRWEFAIIAPRGGLVAQEIEAAGLEDALRPFPTRHDAREALWR